MCVSKDKTLLYYIHQTTPLDGSGVFFFLKKFFGDLQNDTEPHTCLVGDVLTRQVLTVPRWKQSTLDFFHGTPKSPAT